MRAIFVILVVLGLGMALVITNPSAKDVDAELQTQILAQIDAFDADGQADPATKLIAQTCKLGRSACAGILRSVLSVSIDDKVVFSNIQVSLGNTPALSCIGILTKVLCQEAKE